jgi:hypothetical protein
LPCGLEAALCLRGRFTASDAASDESAAFAGFCRSAVDGFGASAGEDGSTVATIARCDAALGVLAALAGSFRSDADESGASAVEDGSASAAFESAAAVDGSVASAEAASAVDVTVVVAEVEAVNAGAACVSAE